MLLVPDPRDLGHFREREWKVFDEPTEDGQPLAFCWVFWKSHAPTYWERRAGGYLFGYIALKAAASLGVIAFFQCGWFAEGIMLLS